MNVGSNLRIIRNFASMIDLASYFKDFDFSVLDDPEYKEDSVRENIIAPIIAGLGYKAKGTNRVRRSVSVTHPYVMIGTSRVAVRSVPDYLCSVGSENVFVLDAKGPKEEITTGDNRQQTFFYAIHPEINVRLFALCNGREFVVFDQSNTQPILYFQVSEIEKYVGALQNLLGPSAFGSGPVKRVRADEKEFDYLSKKPPTEIKNVAKQRARRHFGVHAYFTKQNWQVVQEHIKALTKPGDVVLDPFGGGGVTAIEALMLGRKAINVDLNPLADFIVKTLIQKVSSRDILSGFVKVRDKFEFERPQSRKDINRILKENFWPKDIKLMDNADVKYLHELHTPLQLAELALLRSIILSQKEPIRSQLLLAFSSSLNMHNLTYHASKVRSEYGGDSAAFRYYRFRLAPKPETLDLSRIFENKVRGLAAAKDDLASIPDELISSTIIRRGTATDLSFIPDESVDYIYTDPPYGANIPYLDLSLYWNAWLGFKVTKKEYKLEAIEGGEHEQTRGDYSRLMEESLEQMFKKLKFDRWMSFVFAHKDPHYWHIIVDAAERIGFEYAGAVQQKSGQSSFKKRQRPFTVLFGQLIIHFRKVKNPKAVMKMKLGFEVAEIIQENVEGLIAKNHGATLEEINDELVIRGLEFGFLDILSREYSDLNAYLIDRFDYDQTTHKYHIKPNTKFKSHISLNVRVGYYILSMLRRKRREREDPTFDEIVLEIMPLLKNGVTPENQTILNVLEKLADKVSEDRWRIKDEQEKDLFSTVSE
jgi:DNA modification methylase